LAAAEGQSLHREGVFRGTLEAVAASPTIAKINVQIKTPYGAKHCYLCSLVDPSTCVTIQETAKEIINRVEYGSDEAFLSKFVSA